MVTVGIIVLLIGLLVPMVGSIRASGLSTRCLNNLRQLGSAISSYRLSNKQLLPMTDFLPLVTNEGPEGGLPALLQPTLSVDDPTWICPADFDRESLSTGTSYYYIPGLLRYSPQIQIPVAQALMPLMLDGTLSPSQIERQRIALEARLVTNFYESARDPRRFPVMSDSQDRHPIGDLNPRNGLFLDGGVAPLKNNDESDGKPFEAEP